MAAQTALPRLVLTVSLLVCGATHAGRPMVVDDADVDNAGTGHIEAWYARQPGHAHTWTVSPAYSPVEGLEIDAAITRDRTAASTSQWLQAKWRISPSRVGGCNQAAVLGVLQVRSQPGNTPYVNGLLSCNSAWGATHFNLGGQGPAGGPGVATWGLAHERDFGRATLHVEAFGQRRAKPTFQVGARTLVLPRLQLDASLGRSKHETLLSVGLRQSF
jgi:hypothetical protein